MKRSSSHGTRSSKPGSLRILIADDKALIRSTISRMVEHTGHAVVGEAATGVDALAMAIANRPDVIIMDANMPDMNGIEATRRILEKSPEIGILGISFHDDRHWVHGMLAAGALGFFYKDDDWSLLGLAVETVGSGKHYLSPTIARIVADAYVEADRIVDASFLAEMTDREREVLELTTQGCCAKTIGDRLGISVNTTNTHLRRVMQKLGADSIPGLFACLSRCRVASASTDPGKPAHSRV